MKTPNSLATLWLNAVALITKPLREKAECDAQIQDRHKQMLAAKEQERERLINAFRISLANNAATDGGTTETGIKVLEAAQAILKFEEAEFSKKLKKEIKIQSAIRSGC